MRFVPSKVNPKRAVEGAAKLSEMVEEIPEWI